MRDEFLRAVFTLQFKAKEAAGNTMAASGRGEIRK